MRVRLKKNLARTIAIMLVSSTLSPLIVHADNKKSSEKINISAENITAKSTNGKNSVEKIVDGDINTYWESSDHYRWIEVDLNGVYELSKIDIFNKEGGYYKYNIYASEDGNNYEKVAYKDNNKIADTNGDSYDLGNVKAAKLRIEVNFSSDYDNSNIAELNLYGKKVSNEAPKVDPIKTTNFKGSKWEDEYKKFESDVKYANQKIIAEMKNMVARVIGEKYRDNFEFEIRKKTSSGNDVFEIMDGADGKILIKGNDGVSLASGFNYNLKTYAKVMYNPLMGSNLNMPKKLPKVGEKVLIDTPYEERYSLNFCTYSYTMAFWDWDEYEAFLDWSAMNGINLMLDIIGQEEVLRRTLKEFNYTDEEIKEFISGPAYFAWFYMQNMTSFGGPLPNNWFEERSELGRKMHDRMQTLGIKPVLQGYSGMVPLDFKDKNENAQVIKQGDWCGYDRPDMLKTYVEQGERDYFAEVADVFYEKQKEVFGDITDFYAVDPFHEGGNTGRLNNGKIYETIQKKMIEHDKDSTWVIQHWQGNPNNEKLSGLKKDQALILDLNSDLNPDYKRFDNQDIPWVWNMLHNFGGRMGIDGQPERLATQIPQAYAESKHMKGIGITPEAINNSPIVYELMGDMVWTRDKINFKEWTNDYIERRYGAVNEKAKQAWEILLETGYKKSTYYYQGAPESVINARPAMSINSASTWGHSKIPYDKKEFEKAAKLFIEAYDELKTSEAFIYDFADVLKQILANSAQEYHKSMVDAYNDKDAKKFDSISSHFLELIKLEEEILSTSPEFLVGTWIDQARTMLEGADDWTKDLFEFNARALITTWGDYKNGSLKDYSNRQWSGLTEDYYYARWERWIDGLSKELNGGSKAPSINWHRMEYEWATTKSSTKSYPTQASDKDLKELATKAMQDFTVDSLGSVSQEKVNIALGKTVTSSVETNPEYPTTNLTDGTTGTAWIAKEATWPVELTLDLEGSYIVDGISFAPNQAAGGFPIDYKVEVLSEGTWTKVKEVTGENITGTLQIEYKGKAEKVRLTLNSNSKLLIPEITEIMVYGEKEEDTLEYENIALGKPVTGDTAQSGMPLSNITDGDTSTLWVRDGGVFPASATVDLQGEKTAEKIELIFEKAGLPFKFNVEVKYEDDTTDVVLDKSNNNEVLEKSYTVELDPNKAIKEVKVNLLGKAQVGSIQGAWPAIAEVKVLRKVKEEITSQNVALNKEVTALQGTTTQNGRPLSNIVDGDESSLWIANGASTPAGVNVNLGKQYYIENIDLVFEKEKLPFMFKVEAVTEDGQDVILLDMTKNTDPIEKEYKIPVNKTIRDIRVTITGNHGNGPAYLAWPAIAEIRAYAKPQNNAIGSTITNGLEELIDGNESTSVKLSNEKSFVVDLKKGTDILAIETVNSSDEALKYKVEYKEREAKETNLEWKTLIDKSNNTDKKQVYIDKITNPVYADSLRITYLNEGNVVLNELKIYQADVTSKLLEEINKIENIYNSAVVGEYSGEYTQEAKDTLKLAIDKAKDIISKSPNSKEIEAEFQNLKKSLREFENSFIVIDRIKLGVLISDVESVLNSIDSKILSSLSEEQQNIIKTTRNELELEKNSAILVYEKIKVKQSEIDESYEKLKAKLDEYISILDVENRYNAVISIAENKLNEAVIGEADGNYTEESVNNLKDAVKDAKSKFNDAQSKNEIENIILELKNEIDKFDASVIVVDLSELRGLVSEVKTLNKDDYTKESWKILEDALQEAETVLNSKNPTLTQVSNAKDNLQKAKDNLVKEEVLPILKPEKPENLKVKEVGKDFIKLSWDFVKNTKVKEYIVYNKGKEYTRVTDNNCTVKNLKANTMYNFKVVAVGIDGRESSPATLNIKTNK